KWVVSDPAAPEGWRALHWEDITRGTVDLGDPIPLPAEWQKWTVDQIELELDKPDAQEQLDADRILNLRSFFERLQERATHPRMARQLRMLEVPPVVELAYRGDTVRSEQKLQNQGDHQYSGVLSDLRESVRFTVRGEDYSTPYKQILVVAPPGL